MTGKWFLTVISFLLLAVLIITAFLSNLIFTSRVASESMIPVFKFNERIWGTSIIKPAYYNIICYKSFSTDRKYKNDKLSVSRVIGLEGDTIELNDGFILRNGFIADDPDKLIFTYYTKKRFIYDFKLLDKLKIKPLIFDDSVILNLNSREYNKLSYNILLHKINVPSKLKRYNIESLKDTTCRMEKDITVIVPKGFCFVMGDNRGKEYFPLKYGIINLKNMVGTVIF